MFHSNKTSKREKMAKKYLLLLIMIFFSCSLQQNTLPENVSQKRNSSKQEPQNANPYRALQSIRADPEPADTVRGSHYWTSNEYAHWVWKTRIENIGGALMGVGTDQLYLLAGWAQSQVIIPLDFDVEIINIHFVYGIAFERAQNTSEFRAMWAEENVPMMEEWIRTEYGEQADEIIFSFIRGRSSISHRLRRESEKYEELNIPTFLTDQEQYNYIRNLWINGQVFPVRGDLTADLAMTDSATALRISNVPLRILYLSNAEVYFDYLPTFRRNIIVQPFDQQSVVLRTRHTSRFTNPEGDIDYHYNIQPALSFAHWMLEHDVPNMWRMLRRNDPTEIVGLSHITEMPADDDDYDPPSVATLADGTMPTIRPFGL